MVSKTKTILLCALPGLASVLPMLLKRSPVLNNDMLVAYFCYFWDFHKDWSWAHPLPLWSSSYQCGMPMHAYWQSGYLYPVTWILFGPLSPHLGIHLFYAFHFALAIFGFLKLGPRLGLKPFAAYWAGLCFGLSGTMLARYEHATFLAGWAWMPLVLAAFLALRDAPGPRALAGYAAAVALQALGGHPQASATTALLIAAFTSASVTRALRNAAPPGPVAPRRALAWVLGGHALALVCCLPLVLPFLSLVDRTDRFDGTAWEGEAAVGEAPSGPAAGAPAGAGEKLGKGVFGFRKFSTGGFRALHLLSLAAPHALGSPSNASWWGGEVWGEVFVYIGGLGLFFCAFASPRRAGRDLRLLFAVGLFGLWLSCGAHLGASQIQYHIPVFNNFRRPARFLILFVLALAPLSAHGLQRWLARPRARRALPAAAAAFGAAALLFGLLRLLPGALPALVRVLHHVRPLDPAKDYAGKLAALLGRDAIDCVLLAASAAAAFIAARRPRRALPLLFALLLVDLLRLHWDHFYLFPASYYRVPPASAAALDAATRPYWRVNHYLEYPGDQMWQMHNDPLAHFDLLEREKTALSCGIHAVFGYRHVSAHLPLVWHWDEGLTPGGKSARYLFSNRVMAAFRGDSLVRLGAFGEVIAYEVRDWKPRFETERTASDPAPAVACPEGYAGYRDLCVREPRDGSVRVRGRWRAGDTLMFRERFDAGWSYRVDGGFWRPVREADGHFMAITMEKPGSAAEFRYRPTGFFRLAGACYGFAAAVLLGLLGRRFLRR